ncbi:hypothetical protein EG833_04205 [archaeon]|nr:hypothetical protein [archaeon]
MQHVRYFVFTFMVLAFVFINPAFADDAAKKKALVDATQYAVDLIQKKGKPALDELKTFRFNNGEGYVYVTNWDTVVIMHPAAPELLNKNCIAIKDAKGKFFGAEMKSKAEKSGEGWTWYTWPDPSKNKQPDLKCTYYKVANMKGEKVIVYAADFGISQAACQ